MGLTKLAVNRPLTILMIILMVVIMGYRAYTFLEVERLPKTDLPVVSISVAYPGASPEDIQDQIVKPLEDAVAGISGIDTLNSSALEGVGSVIITFVQGVNTNQAAIDVERQVAAARRNLPSDAGDPVVSKADINAQPIIQLVLSGPQGQDALYQYAVNDVQPQLESVDGVASVNIRGGRQRQININLNQQKMAAYGLSLQTVQTALSGNNLTVPAGSLDQGKLNLPIRAVGQFTGLDDVRNLVVSNGALAATGSAVALPGQNPGGLVYLRDIATVEDGYADRTTILRFNGTDTVSIGVVKTSDANTILVSQGVRAKLAGLNALLPPGAKLSVMTDSSVYTAASVQAVQEDLILAILITGLVMLVFLHTIRSTFIVLLAIPTSIIATFLVMYALGFTLNTMTLMALTLIIGILVDDSIVVLENTERHLKMGKRPRQAALDGRSEIGLAAITITLVDVVVYLPVAFVSGTIGQFFRSYGITIVAATLFSLIISFTLTPMLASQWLKPEDEVKLRPTGMRRVLSTLFLPISWIWHGFVVAWEWGFERLAAFYGVTVRVALKNFWTQALVVLVAVAAFGAGMYLVTSGVIGTEFMPQEDDGQFSINVTMPPGTNLTLTDAAARQVEQIIRSNVPEAAMINTSVGGGGGFRGNTTNTASIDVFLVDKTDRRRGIVQITDQLRPRLGAVPDARTSVTLNSAVSFGFGFGGGAIQVQFLGPDLAQLTQVANQAEAIMRQVPGVSDVINTDAATSGETQLVVDRSRLSDLGLTSTQVGSGLRTALSGSQVGTFAQAGQPNIPVIVRMDDAARSNLDTLLETPLTYANGNPIVLRQAVQLQNAQAPVRIGRTNRELVLNIRANPTGRAAGDVSNDIEAALKANMVFPTGYTFQFSGGTQQQRTSFAAFGGALGLSVVLIYMLLVALYQSWMAPLSIMFALPVTIVGAFGGLLVTHRTLNIISLLGVILLTGIVTKNAILIIDFAEQLQEDGLNRKQALVQAGRLRLRPILMTTAALVFALLPLLFHSGAGSELRAPMAAVVIGGSLTSTLLSLLLVPVAYNTLEGFAGWLGRTTRRLAGTPPERLEEAPAPIGGGE